MQIVRATEAGRAGRSGSARSGWDVAPCVVAELVLGGVAVQVLARNLMVNAENAALEQAEESFRRVRMDARRAFGTGVFLGRVRNPKWFRILLPNHL